MFMHKAWKSDLTQKNEVISQIQQSLVYSTSVQQSSELSNRIEVIHQIKFAGGLQWVWRAEVCLVWVMNKCFCLSESLMRWFPSPRVSGEVWRLEKSYQYFQVFMHTAIHHLCPPVIKIFSQSISEQKEKDLSWRKMTMTL